MKLSSHEEERRGQATVRRLAALVGAVIVWTASCGNGASSNTSSACAFALSPRSASQAASGGTGSVTVTTDANCSWTATSNVAWVTVTGGSTGRGVGTVTYGVAPNANESARSAAIEVVHVNGQSVAAVHQLTQQGATTALPSLVVSGAYTFWLEADPDGTCGWPVTTFLWPVSVEVTSYGEGATSGAMAFPATSSTSSNEWALYTTPTTTRLVPGRDSPGRAAAAYDLVVDGGRWEAGGPTRAHDGRGEIANGTAIGTRLVLVVPGSDKQWECRSDAKWSLLIRWFDRD